jgi:hypothetical protein
VRIEKGGGQSTTYEVEPMAVGEQNIAQAYLHHLNTGEPLHPTLDLNFNLEVMAILDAGVRAADSGKLEAVENGVWSIG